VSRETRVTVRLSAEEARRLDEVAREAGTSQAGALRELLRSHDSAPRAEAPTPQPSLARAALAMLAQSARDGSVPARIALAKLLAENEPERDPITRRRDELRARRERKYGPPA
jgi:hypothetical protein